MMSVLDFDLLPNFNSSSAWYSLNNELRTSMAKFPQTIDRAESSLHFCWAIDNGSVVFEKTDTRSVKRREGYLRASLAEFVSMEETLKRDLTPLKRDLTPLGISATPLKINHSKNPLLHMIRELRNFEIHLYSSKLSSATRTAIYANENIEIDIWMVGDIQESNFRKLRNARNYDDKDISKLIDWFNNAQKHWGIHDLIHRAVTAYCDEIKTTYSL